MSWRVRSRKNRMQSKILFNEFMNKIYFWKIRRRLKRRSYRKIVFRIYGSEIVLIDGKTSFLVINVYAFFSIPIDELFFADFVCQQIISQFYVDSQRLLCKQFSWSWLGFNITHLNLLIRFYCTCCRAYKSFMSMTQFAYHKTIGFFFRKCFFVV